MSILANFLLIKFTLIMTRIFISFLAFFFILSSHAQSGLTVEHIVDGTFNQKTVSKVNWMNDGRYYTALNENRVIKYDITTGESVEMLVDGNKLDLSIDNYTFSADEDQILLLTDRQKIYRRSYTGIFYIYNLTNGELELLSEGKQAYATFSPDGKKIAFTRENNLFYKDLSSGEETTITSDGKFNYTSNGSTNWVYEEELYLTKVFEWSPDSKRIAFYRFDESDVRQYNMQVWNDGAIYPEDYRYKYPKAGEANSVVEIYVYSLETGDKVKANTGEETDIYIPRIYWTKDPSVLSVQRLNRLQNTLDILHVDASTGSSDVILTDQSDTYIDFTYCDDLTYLENGKQFLFSSEKDGYKHFYLHNMSGKLVTQVTKGDFEAVSMVGLDQSGRKPTLYYLSTETSPQERLLYSIGLDGKGKKRLSKDKGLVSVNMSGDCKYYISYHSSTDQPKTVDLYEVDKNKNIKTLEDNSELVASVEKFDLAEKSYFSFETVDGTELFGYMLKPTDFNDSRKYPLMIYQYSGPGSQNVNSSWGGSHFIWHQLLVQNGYIVAVVDGRGTGYRGADFKKQTYKELGKLEVVDQIEAARYLGSLDYIEEDRIGIWGWSYGGYMSSLAILKGAGIFKAAIAVAPVTTWRFYDTIYTERYLQRPQDNPGGYDENSPIHHADKLEGHFLLIHGTGDDNVHFQNAVALQENLIKAGKDFDTFYYPDEAHGISKSRKHVYSLMTEFVLENL